MTRAPAPGHLHLLRLTLEAESPLAIGSGRVATRRRRDPDTGIDAEVTAAAVIRDANGLPTIPGPSLQGVLRRLAREVLGEAKAVELLGIEGGRHDEGRAGRVIFGWGWVHDRANRAADPRPGPAPEDALLAFLTGDSPLWRDHVALSDRLSVDERKKFARTAVPRGTRFSLELAMFGDGRGDDLIRLAALVRHPAFRLGAARGAGYGRLKVIAASHAALPLTDPATIRARRAEAPSVPLATDLLAVGGNAFAPPGGGETIATPRLRARDLIRFGAATDEAAAWTPGTRGARRIRDAAAPQEGDWRDDPRPAGEHGRDPENLLKLLTEPLILWDGAQGRALTPRDALRLAQAGAGSDRGTPARAALGFPVPGSQVRGALAHRALYHWNRRAGRTVDAEAYAAADAATQAAMRATLAAHAARPPELGAFLGAAKGPAEAGAGRAPGQAGKVAVDDGHIEAGFVFALDHISIDRFTGGVRNVEGVLYAEEALFGAELALTLRIAPGPGLPGGGETVGGWPTAVADALLLALRDLCTGRLPLGARSLGACTGTVAWSGGAAGAWAARARACGVPAAEGGRP